LSHIYVSPKFYRETLAIQQLRLEQEWEDARLSHALKTGRASLRYLETRRMCGEVFSKLETEIMMHTRCKMDGVAPEYIPAVVSLIIDRYVPKAA
jgi:hypothetical protein